MVKVAVLGASGGIGQPLSLLLKLSPYVSKLSLYDVRDPSGTSVDLSHINTIAECQSFDKDQLVQALGGARVVVIPAGVPRKPGMTRDDLFKVNASIMRGLCEQIVQVCPLATVLIISNPVNSLVPVAIETFKKHGINDASRIMGITTLDLVRAETFLGDYMNNSRVTTVGSNQFDKRRMHKVVSVIGGHSGHTIIPVMLLKPMVYMMKPGQYDSFIHRVQFGGDEVVKAKQGQGSATYSMAYAGYRFVEYVLKSIQHESLEGLGYIPAYVYLPGLRNGSQAQAKLGSKELEYFSVPIQLVNGRIDAVDTTILDKLSEQEKLMVEKAVPELIANAKKGQRFIHNAAKL
ncbi:similar to Saccharomyces cerevisiae YDL078C MDH3 Peroxisomal malate dehydrogenase, catalyzes interconversion of malate and oxaloacetate [Maudiozyma barnettii]|uniref:Malate dehydrogenase n=1 Tax=Maudiozyma barnettii TaxID=61262 RepID=A0A8H2VKL8_9SACH|nr:malate dehydrogenase MDH3 [Kazachstania barnettii]CAB4257101.1 similar to Saccharomyces cerevisiae YDL078C MDH3 Peroxisomal malate dehydrogenase, catalyzes interconversion of malate and oxaloacetate [Kazachstania barnettii]CAD1779471.1 similar to Saccharomyces cerevisiae YDL078C MDH3 Peroxisomal malate dehydrogenase, catalyzes interconversion of malate and oxaloacetate [Kazachstania barnettii]